jgi:hypothetical protein
VAPRADSDAALDAGWGHYSRDRLLPPDARMGPSLSCQDPLRLRATLLRCAYERRPEAHRTEPPESSAGPCSRGQAAPTRSGPLAPATVVPFPRTFGRALIAPNPGQ